MYKTKTEDAYENFSKIVDLSNYAVQWKYYDNSNKLLVCKIKGDIGGVAIKEFVGLKPKMYSFLVDHSSEHKKAKSVNKNVAATIIHVEYKIILMN